MMDKDTKDELIGGLIGILVVVLFSLPTSCRTQVRYVPVEIKTEESISIHDTIIKETLVPYKDSISIQDTISFLSNPYGYSWATYSDGNLRHSLGILPNAFLLARIPQYMTITRTREVPKIVEVEKKLTRWQQFKVEFCEYIIVIVVIMTLIIVGQMVYKLKK